MSIVGRIDLWLSRRRWRADGAAILTLSVLWALFFWRALTPNPANQISLADGDFSGQFYAFGGYQATRILAGEVPLWNPFNNGGHPFLADVQTAAFYPPRLLTILFSKWLPPHRWTYGAFQLEVLAHFWMTAVLMYLFVRTLTGYRIAGMVSAITITFGGYLTSYPPLQVAILETGTWLPLALLGLLRGTEERHLKPAWLALTSLALGMALLAGHPQTALHFTYLLIAFFVYRAIKQKLRFWPALVTLALVLLGGYGLAALQIIPAAEYLRYTTRADIGVDALGNGFDFSELPQIVLPGVITVWSPLYSGIAALALAVLAVWRVQKSARFWAVLALLALGLSLGRRSILFVIAYLVVPGFQLFRGQERAAFEIAHSIAILAGLGTLALLRWSNNESQAQQRLMRWLAWFVGAGWVVAIEALVARRIFEGQQIQSFYSQAVFTAILLTLTLAVISLRFNNLSSKPWQPALLALLVFDLFSNNINASFDQIPASQQYASILESNLLVNTAGSQNSSYRIDGSHVLGWNYGSLLNLQDISGVSPLRLQAVHSYLEGMPQHRAYELLSVELVLTNREQLDVASVLLAMTEDDSGTFFLHQIDDPRPRALLLYDVQVMDDEAALVALQDSTFDLRRSVILDAQPDIELTTQEPDNAGQAKVIVYEPEHIVIETDSAANAILSVSEVYYPGWQASVDGEPVPILRAYAGLRAVSLEAGQHMVEMRYRPLSFQIGLAISAASALSLLATTLWGVIKSRGSANHVGRAA